LDIGVWMGSKSPRGRTIQLIPWRTKDDSFLHIYMCCLVLTKIWEKR